MTLISAQAGEESGASALRPRPWSCSQEGMHGRTGVASRALAAGVGLAAGAYAAYVAVAWRRYGHVTATTSGTADDLLDQFMPVYDVVERHHIRVAAPAHVTMAAAREMDITHGPIVRAIFKGRELLLRSAPDVRPRPRQFVPEMLALGWGVLAEVRDREIVMGGVTKPWQANPVFRAIPPCDFAAFQEPELVKIVWTLRADPLNDGESIFRTETRAIATDAGARAKFRRYWAFLSPGIILIRWLTLPGLRAEAERRVRDGALSEGAPRPAPLRSDAAESTS